MKHLMGLGLAGFLGVVAAATNWIWLSGLATPDEFVGLRSDIAFGGELSEDDLQPVPIPGDSEQLRESFVPWADRAILFGATANRKYVAGDLVLHRDIQPPREVSEWDVIGPFKLISVGERFKERTEDENQYTRTDGNNLTIAVDASFDERTKRLLEVIRPDRPGDGEQRTNIVAVQVLPATNRAASEDLQNVVYQTVSLDGIANVPRVLLAGDMIRFVVPGRPVY